MTAITTWYTYPAQPLSPLIYLLWNSFVPMAKHMEFLLNYKISCSDTITSHMGLDTKHDSYNYWYSTKQCNKNKNWLGRGGGGICLWYQYMHGSLHPNTQGRTLEPTDLMYTSFPIMHSYVSHLIPFFLLLSKTDLNSRIYVCMFRVIIKDQ